MTNMKFFRVILALLGGTHALYAQPSASPTVKTGGSSIASVVAGSKPTRSWDKPQFDDIAPRNITAIVGQTAELNCYVKHPGDRVLGKKSCKEQVSHYNSKACRWNSWLDCKMDRK
ncbi:PREDICTED: uncharacterized protein LOC108777208 [Cyphomyrmex costatus]|uniref:uncharacterized protein LOC108777208 n=1 Tax=Cyphomyrmex costatus TaxID=456900 RepID=UPI0008524222|nr:PREDICTED: uncharacterized protein LOC108777208 [Cyphomyrmex costatus]